MDTDEALFERLVRGDMRAFERLYDRFERPLYGFIRAQIGDDAEAEDVLHEAFMAVLRERERATRVRSFRAWIYEVARNICLNRARSKKRAGRAMQKEAALEPSLPPSAELEMERAETLSTLQRSVERLPAPLAEVYRLRASGMSYEEVAEVLGVPVGTVKSRMHDMVKRLRGEVPQ